MALLTRAGVITVPTPAAIPSTFDQTVELGFEPKVIFFFWGTADPAGTLASECGFGFGAAVAPGLGEVTFEGLVDSAYANFTGTQGGTIPRAVTYADDNTCAIISYIEASAGGADAAGATVASFTTTGFTLTWVRDGVLYPISLNYLALGGDDVTNACIRQCRCPSADSSKSFNGCGFQPDSILLFGGRGLSRVTAGLYPSIGFANATTQRVVSWGVTYSDIPTPASADSSQLSTHVLRYISSTGSITGQASLTSLDADGFTLNFTNLTAAASTYFWAVCLKGVDVDILDVTQPATPQTQNITTAVNAKAALLLTTGKAASSSITANGQIGIGAVAGTGQQANVWSDIINGTSPINSFRDVSSYALRMWTTSSRVTPAAVISSASLTNGNVALTWSSADATARSVFALVFGGLDSSETSSEVPASSSETPYYCYNQFVNSDFAYELQGWTTQNAVVNYDGSVRLYSEYGVPAYVEQTVPGLVSATLGTLSVYVNRSMGSSPTMAYLTVRDASNGVLLAELESSATGVIELPFVVPASGQVVGRVSAVTNLEFTYGQIDIDNVQLDACSYLTSSITSFSSETVPVTSSSSSLVPTPSSSSLVPCDHLIGDSFTRSSIAGLGYTDGLSTDGLTSVGGADIEWLGGASDYLAIVSGKAVRPFGATWLDTLAYAEAGYYNGTLTSSFQLHSSSLVKAAGYLLRVVDDTSYTHVHITHTAIQIVVDGTTEIASTTIFPYLPLDTPLTAIITVNGDLGTVTIYNGVTQLASLAFSATHNPTATQFGIRVLNSTSGTFYDYFYFDNCAAYSSLWVEPSSSYVPPSSEIPVSSSSYVIPESSLISSETSEIFDSSSLTIIDDIGRQQIAVDQNQGGTRFPFIDPSDNLDLLIGDLYLRYTDRYCQLTAPFRISWLYGFGTRPAADPTGGVHQYDMQIVDANDNVVFDSRDAYSFTINTWTPSKLILEWVTADDEILRIVIYRTWTISDTPRNWDRYFEPAESTLDPRTVERAVPSVTSLRIATSLTDTSSDILLPAGKVLWRAGYNMLLTPETVEDVDGSRRYEPVLLEAVPGAGLGQYPGCEATPVLRRINGVTADEAGNLRVDALECYRLERPIAESDPEATGSVGFTEYTYLGPVRNIRLQPAALKLSNDCGPCCECDDFVNVYEAIRKISNRYAELGRRAELVRDQYRENITRWEAQRECRQANLIQVAMMPLGPCRLAVAASLCNGTSEPLLDAEVSLDLTASSIAGCVVCGTTYRRGNVDPYRNVPPSRLMPYKLGGGWPIFTANFDCINEGENGYVTFVLQFAGCTAADVVSMTLTASAAGGANPGGAQPITAVSGLITSPDTGDCCEVSSE